MTDKEKIVMKLNDCVLKLNNMYLKANTKSKMNKIALDLYSFEEMYNKFFNDCNINDMEWLKDYDLYDTAFRLSFKNRLEFLNNILLDKEKYRKISSCVLDNFKDTNFPLYKDIYNIINKLSKKEFNNIVGSFLYSYDEKLCSDYIRKAKDNELFYAKLEGTHLAETVNIINLKKNFVFLGFGNYSVYSASLLLHELGHVYEMELDNSIDNDDYFKNKMNKTLYETSSRFFEYAFLKYLEENKIFIKSTNDSLFAYYMDLLHRMYSINLFANVEEFNIVGSKIVPNITDNIKSQSYSLAEKFNYYNFSELVGEYEFEDFYIYGIGSLFAIYLYDFYKEDKKSFKIEFKKSLNDYRFSPDKLDVFKNLGVTDNRIMNGNVLKRELKKIK